jgi:hypothetical protein
MTLDEYLKNHKDGTKIKLYTDKFSFENDLDVNMKEIKYIPKYSEFCTEVEGSVEHNFKTKKCLVKDVKIFDDFLSVLIK